MYENLRHSANAEKLIYVFRIYLLLPLNLYTRRQFIYLFIYFFFLLEVAKFQSDRPTGFRAKCDKIPRGGEGGGRPEAALLHRINPIRSLFPHFYEYLCML